jgi:DNA-binding transcriptional ArsR family regulator
MHAMPVALVDRPDAVRAALSPIRRQLLERLREPASATELAGELRVPRQRLNYHLRMLERAGLLELVEERQRRGCVERILRARAQAFVVDPAVFGRPRRPAASADAQDRFSAEHLIDAAGDVVRHVARMRGRAAEQGTRLLTFAVESELTFATPADFERFTTALAAFVAREAASHARGDGGRAYRILLAGHPAPGKPAGVTHARSRHRRSAHRRAH